MYTITRYAVSSFVLLALLLPAQFTHASELEDSLVALQQKVDALSAYVEARNGSRESAALTALELEAIVTAGTQWLIQAQESTGRFKYEYEPFQGDYLSGDNIVRQAGALFQLGEVVRRDNGNNPELAAAIESSIDYFESLSKEDEFLKVSFRCIVEDAESTTCKLGATSLALIGILSYIEAYPEKESEYEDLIDDYLSFILVSRNLSGGFRNIHHVGLNGQPSAESAFSNGEALLALTRYLMYRDSSVVKRTRDDALSFITKDEYDTALYLWIMAALKDMPELSEHEEYLAYTKDFTLWRINGITPRRATRHNYCAYAEGVVSAYGVLEDHVDADYRDMLRGEIDFWNTKNSRLQIMEDTPARAVLDGDTLEFLTVADMDVAQGGFLTGDNVLTQRIDFTQHCVSAYLQTLVDVDGVAYDSTTQL